MGIYDWKLYRLIDKECPWKHYYYQPLGNDTWMNRNIMFPVKLFLKRWLGAIYLPFNPKYNVQQFDGDRKSKFTMLIESLLWTFKYKEVCHYYFLYGLDLKSKTLKEYVAYTEFRVLRNIINFRNRETIHSLYTFNYLALARDKFIFYQYCKSLGMPYPETYALVNKGKITWLGDDDMTFEPLCSLAQHELDVFCKEVNGESGRGAFALTVHNGVVSLNGHQSDVEELSALFGDSVFVVQKKLRNHSDIQKIYPSSLNTLKLITILNEDGSVVFFDAAMRFGTGGNIIDNAGSGGIFVGVDDSGYLQDVGYYEPGFKSDLVVHGVHPDTGVSFAGMRLPFWDDMLAAAFRFHRFFYGIPSIGWDIAFTPDGFVFTETGEDWEIPLYQVTNGGMRERFYKYHGKALDVKLRNYI